MIVLVDMDGVLADFDAEFARRYELAHRTGRPDDGPDVDVTTRAEFKVDTLFPAQWTDRVRAISAAAGFFRGLPVVPGAVEGLSALEAAGHDVFICTAPLTRYENCVAEKFAWVEQHLGPRWVSRIVMTKDKTLVHGDVLIDDKPHVTGVRTPDWEHVRYTRSYNAAVADVPRLTWDNAVQVLADLAADRAA